MTNTPVRSWLYTTSEGLYCAPGQFFIDPRMAVDRAVITHGHSDHARPGHGAVLATAETIAVMKARYGAFAGGNFEPLAYGHAIDVNGVSVRLVPAGHILGSAQVVMEWGGKRAVVSGDYKREADPTCAPFELVTCDVFVTEATFGLPVFRHEPAEKEAARLLASLSMVPERTHLLGAYSLGKAQRMIAVLRSLGYDRPIYLHGAMVALCTLYQTLGIDLGMLVPVNEAGGERLAGDRLAGEIVIAPPSALNDRWSRRLAEPLTVFASGWMRVRGRARQRGVELPLVVSDHADWDALVETIAETEAEEIWVTHGRDDALVHQIGKMGRRGRALALIGYEDEDE
ncbi:ligase-associated DNA damage response exonuclease [Rhodoligotrophos defluvii]|uniref:ligase-associated DNA damage response exonuclease n=1 Tax=Rhodoligotrophos defluvii TaxID=2561934 RepID=UPI0010C9A13D|nr:ligase-associated DNA damage response exonuclease [Rhodoligotrophos defluvii]